MNPQTVFCHNPACSSRGQVGKGNIVVHSRKEARYRCTTCRRTFAATTGTPLFRLQTPAETVALVLALLGHGCPLQAIVAAFRFDERTVARWLAQAGQHCQRFHAHWVEHHPVELQHVQADELWVKAVGRCLWLAMAIAVESRLWLGGVIGAQRDLALVLPLARMVRACARSVALLICVDGLAAYREAFRRAFRRAVRTGRAGRPKLLAEEGWMLGQMIKQYAKRRVVGVAQRVVVGRATEIRALLERTKSGQGIHTAYIERLNATFRGCLTALCRRGRALVRTERTLTAGVYLVGCLYNFCWEHASLRVPAEEGGERKWQERTPAMAARLTPVRWTLLQLLTYHVPIPVTKARPCRGRLPKQADPRSVALAA